MCVCVCINIWSMVVCMKFELKLNLNKTVGTNSVIWKLICSELKCSMNKKLDGFTRN